MIILITILNFIDSWIKACEVWWISEPATEIINRLCDICSAYFGSCVISLQDTKSNAVIQVLILTVVQMIAISWLSLRSKLTWKLIMLVGSYGRGFRLLMLVKGWHQMLVTVLHCGRHCPRSRRCRMSACWLWDWLTDLDRRPSRCERTRGTRFWKGNVREAASTPLRTLWWVAVTHTDMFCWTLYHLNCAHH